MGCSQPVDGTDDDPNPYADAYEDLDRYREKLETDPIEYAEVIGVLLSHFEDQPVPLEDLWAAFRDVPVDRFDLDEEEHEWDHMRDEADFLASLGFVERDYHNETVALTDKGRAMVFEMKEKLSDDQLEVISQSFETFQEGE